MGSPPIPAGGAPQRHDKVTAFVSRSATAPEPKLMAPASTDHLDAFGSEEPKRPEAPPPSRPLVSRDMRPVWVGVGIVAASAVLIALILYVPALVRGSAQSSMRAGRVTIGTTPMGADVAIDGQPKGLTPVTAQLEPGTHTITMQRGADTRTVTIQVAAGAEMSQHYEFAPQPAPVLTSTLSIITEPPGARVSIDGEPRGTSPVTVAALSAGRHRVTVAGETGTLERQVTIEAGVAASVVYPLPKTAPVSAGWLSIASPFDVQVIEKGDVIGTSASPRFMVPAGAHEVDLVNEGLGFREHRRIDVSSGATASVKIDAHASVNANARPWADVIVDGKPVGQTPISNLSLTLGSHQFVFRHPDLGERQQTVLVTAKGPNRIAVDLSK